MVYQSLEDLLVESIIDETRPLNRMMRGLAKTQIGKVSGSPEDDVITEPGKTETPEYTKLKTQKNAQRTNI